MERTSFIGGSVALAAAALTVAVGVTVASLGGYLRPARDQAPAIATVLVPVTPSPTAAPQTPSEPMFASNADHERRDRDRHSEREREHEHEDD